MLSAGCNWIYKWFSTHMYTLRCIYKSARDSIKFLVKIHDEGKNVFLFLLRVVAAQFCLLLSTISDVLLNFVKLLDALRVSLRVCSGFCVSVCVCHCDDDQIRNKRHHQTIITLNKRIFLPWTTRTER